MKRLVFSWLLLAIGVCRPALAEPPAWDGLDQLRALAQDMGHPPRGGTQVDVGVLDSRDGVLLVGPTESLPLAGIGGFLDAGGRVAVLDDVGDAEQLLRAYRIQTRAAPARGVTALRDDPRLLLAEPQTDHPLTEDVRVLLTNRPVSLFHDALKPVFSFSGTEAPLVLAGAVGEGRLVAIGDASLLLNQMLELPHQRRFAQNLIRYLTESGGELWVVGPGQTLFGTYGKPHKPGVERMDALLGELSHPDLPRWLVMALTAAAVVAATVWVLGSLPKVTPYLTRAALPTGRIDTGYAGRVEAASRDSGNLLWAALDYRKALLEAMSATLGVDRPGDGRPLVEAAGLRGMTEASLRSLSDLLTELDALASAEEHADTLPRVDPAQLQHMVTTGERLVGELEKAAA